MSDREQAPGHGTPLRAASGCGCVACGSWRQAEARLEGTRRDIGRLQVLDSCAQLLPATS